MSKMMNEIHHGYINLPSLHSFDYNTNLHLSHIRKRLLFSQNECHNYLQLLHLNHSNWVLAIQQWSAHGRVRFQCQQN